jgi:hypothetical protein
VQPSRRTLLKASGLAVAATAVPLGPARAEPRPVQEVQLRGTAFGSGQYLYHPFTVPPGVNRLDVRIDKQGDAVTGLGIFDARGSHYATLERPNGFRGIYGEERGEFFLSPSAASQSFLPGPIAHGEWTAVVPVFRATRPTPYVVTVRMSRVPSGKPFAFGAAPDVVLDEPGWYRGDLHAHTPESSDAWRSGSALTPREWAQTCRRIGLDFLALTDHNVISQNIALDEAAGEDVLLLAGEEMTNWFHGHATVSGIAPGEWFDWRQRPAGELSAAPDPRTGSIQEFLRAARASGALVSAAHPLGATLAWQFFPEAAVDPAARTDSVEVWTGPFQPDDQASVDAWDAMNRQGQRLVANGGSDLHGVDNTGGFAAGTPTTVVHAEALSKRAVIAALRAGRSFITREPSGVELYLAGSLQGQRQIMGGTLYGAPPDVVDLEVVVRRAAGMRLVLMRDGVPVSTTKVASDDETVPFTTTIGAGGFVRVEVRSAPTFLPERPRASTMDMEALTNPVWLEVGEPPAGTEPDRTRPPAKAGPRRGGQSDPTVARSASPGGSPPAPSATPGPSLPATGAPAVAVGGAALLAGATVARRMTLTEFGMRAAAGAHTQEPVLLTGQVTAVDGDAVCTLSRWVPGCCSADAQVDVRVVGLAEARVGQWWEVTGRPDGELLRVEEADLVDVPPSRREA